MKRIILLFLLSLFLEACGHGRTQYFPKEGNDDTHAHVTIIRSVPAGGVISAKVVLDGWVINYIKEGEYLKFHVEPGVHATCLQESPIVMSFEKGKKYYFKIGNSPYIWLPPIFFHGHIFDCEQIKQENFEEMIKSKYLYNSEYRDEYKEQDPNLKETQ